jgi:hypothetical protein
VVELLPGTRRIAVERVGPFEVTARSATPLRATLALALALIVALALWHYRRGSSAQ